jgi:biopolymer transport protein ExbD
VAFSFQSSSGGRRRTSAALAEINIVPLVDVVLVLLVIFMLTAHVMEFGLEVDVPKVKQVRDSTRELPVVNMTRGGAIYLNEQPININEISRAVASRFPGQTAVYVRADKAVTWDLLSQVVSALGEAKLQVMLVIQPEDSASKR